jgi:hypothetical protein
VAEGLRVRVKIAGVDEIKRAFRRMSDEAKTELKRASEEIATDLAAKIRVAAVASSAQSALMAGTVKAAKGMVPIITAGGSARVGRNLKPAHKILFGAEFGAHTLRQFRPFTGNDGYWFFRTIRDNEQEISDKYNDAADRITRQFGSDA